MKITRLTGCAGGTLSAMALLTVLTFLAAPATAQSSEEIACTSSFQCPEGQYCNKADGDCDGEGKCVDVPPPICPQVWDPVCGCDNRTYGNACHAAAAGVNVAYEGECEDIMCILNEDCPGGWYCKSETGHCGGFGVCEPKPEICPLIWDPVCGCDGQTYGNDCMAAMKGVSVAFEGTCESVGPCKEDDDCPYNFFCQTDPGDCDGEGTCTQYPQLCPLIWAPVCGCDGVTYGNNCFAAMNGASVAHEGECEPGCCEGDFQCPPGHFCETAPGDCDGEGFCREIPSVCPLIFDPVCGCDGQTYENDCIAAMNQVSVAYKGQCIGGACGANSMCADGFYCRKKDGDCDGQGRCTKKPEVCTLVWDPVCGCDGHTYSNTCWAAANGVNVAYEGECKEDACVTDSMCTCGSYCAKQIGDCDGIGKCTEIPEGVCPAVWDPVCGCDGLTYGNACEAAVAGMNIKHPGECGGGAIASSNSMESSGFNLAAFIDALTGREISDAWELLILLEEHATPNSTR